MVVKDNPSEHLLYEENLKEVVLFGLEIRRAFQGVHVYISPVHTNMWLGEWGRWSTTLLSGAQWKDWKQWTLNKIKQIALQLFWCSKNTVRTVRHGMRQPTKAGEHPLPLERLKTQLDPAPSILLSLTLFYTAHLDSVSRCQWFCDCRHCTNQN